MVKGCLALVFCFVAAAVANSMLLPERWDFERILYAPALALLLTMTVAALWSVKTALRRLWMSRRDPQRWGDGEVVAHSGELRPLRETLRSPVTQKPVLLYEMKSVHPYYNSKWKRMEERIDLGSLAMAPCALYTAAGMLRVIGMPPLVHFKTREYDNEPYREHAAHFIAAREWKRYEPSIRGAMTALRDMYDNGEAATEQHTVSPSSKLPVPLQKEQDQPVRHRVPDEIQDMAKRLHRLLKQQKAILRETIVEPGSTVTVFGVFRADIRAIDIGGGLLTVQRGMYPGSLPAIVRGNLLRSSLSSVVFGLATATAHYGLYRGDGGWLRWLVEWAGL